MATDDWWLPNPREELSQGDVLGPLNFYAPLWPLKHLRYQDFRGKGSGWAESDEAVTNKNGLVHVLGHVKSAPGIIISHGCEIDKPNKGTRVQIAMIIELKTLREDIAANVRAQKSVRYMPLPNMPLFGDSAVEFRSITGFPADVVSATTKVASLSDDACIRLQAALWVFFTRREDFPEPNSADAATAAASDGPVES